MTHHFGPWIDWSGGDCPVAPSEGIQIQCRNETREQAETQFVETGVFYMWEHRGGTGDIVAYRVSMPLPQPDTYRGWTISYDPPPIPMRDFDWRATGPNYDASYEGAEDGWVDNGEKANGPTRDALIAEIDAWFEEHSA